MQVLKKLQRKVHPEEMTDKHIPSKDVCKIEVDDGNKMVGPAVSKKRENTKKLSSDDTCKGSSTTIGGRWIKTDSDCKLKCEIYIHYYQLRNLCSIFF